MHRSQLCSRLNRLVASSWESFGIVGICSVRICSRHGHLSCTASSFKLPCQGKQRKRITAESGSEASGEVGGCTISGGFILWFGKILQSSLVSMYDIYIYIILYYNITCNNIGYVNVLEILEVCRYCVTGGPGLSVTPTISADISLSHHVPTLVVILRSNLLGRKRLRRFLSPRQRTRMAEVHGWLHWTCHDTVYCGNNM